MGIVRGDSDQVATLELAEGWRRLDDISWRASSWGLRRMVTGGLVLVSLSGEERKTRELPAGGMALRIKHVGQCGAHAAGKNAGFQTDDVLVSYDGRTDLMTVRTSSGMALRRDSRGTLWPSRSCGDLNEKH